ncbi:MAG: ABC transporter substrate-binding protein [Magnetovibrionaceae bacterium]
MRAFGLLILGLLAALPVQAFEVPYLEGKGLPPMTERLPETPSRVEGLEGLHGGTLEMLMARAKDTRMMTVYGYARLVGYNQAFELKPDILERVEVEENRIFTLHLRKGHRWSDGHPFTTEDFRYWYEDVANNIEMSPAGPPAILRSEGMQPLFEVLDETRVRYTWPVPHPTFLAHLASPRPFYIYMPAHYMRQFHAAYAEPKALRAAIEAESQRNWVALHNRKGRMYRQTNPDLPTLQPWVAKTAAPAQRFTFERNPYYHRVDSRGRQLPYLDKVLFTVANAKLIPVKAAAGETDLQARYLTFKDITALKQGERRNPYKARLWRTAKGAQVALYPNLNHVDPVWRGLFRKADFRRALSLAINRHEINQVIYFGLALANANTLLPNSPLYDEAFARSYADFDLERANALLDGLGFTTRDGRGVRLMADGTPLEIIVETAGESTEETDVLELIHDSWLKAGIKLHPKPLQREVLRNRVFAGQTKIAVWFGLENGVASPDSDPTELVPSKQNQLQWPKWGQFLETGGRSGKPIDMMEPLMLQSLGALWRRAGTGEERKEIWRQILQIHAEQVFTIGVVGGVLQPVLVHEKLKGVPEEGIYNWDPGAHFGLYRPDTFWFEGEVAR